MNFKNYYKAIIAFGVPFLGLLTTFATDKDVADALPGVSKWLIVVGIPVASGILTFLKRNQPTVDEALAILQEAKKRNGNTPASETKDGS